MKHMALVTQRVEETFFSGVPEKIVIMFDGFCNTGDDKVNFFFAQDKTPLGMRAIVLLSTL